MLPALPAIREHRSVLTCAGQVEKAETPKTPKGRAHKREQYTRRFVNVTTAPGGKRKVRVLARDLRWQG